MTRGTPRFRGIGPARRLRQVSRADVALMVFALAVFVLVTYLTPASIVENSDEADYLAFAGRLVHGGYVGPGESFLWWPPGVPLVLTPPVAAGAPIGLIRLIGPVTLFAVVVVFRLLASWYVRRPQAQLATVLLVLYAPLDRLLPRVFSEPLAALCFLLFVALSSRFILSGRRSVGLGAGLALGYLGLTRAEYGWVIVGLIVVFGAASMVLRHHAAARRSLAVSLVAFAVLLPWLAYTASLTGTFPYWGNSGGLSLYWMTVPDDAELGDWHSEAEVFTSPVLARHRPLFRSLEHLGPVERDARLQRLARHWLLSHPLHYARNLVANLSRLWFRFPFSHEPASLKPLPYAFFGALLLGALTVAGSRLLRRRWCAPELAPALAVIVISSLIHVAVAGYPRSLAPLIPFFFLLSAIGLSDGSIESRRSSGAGGESAGIRESTHNARRP
jgi:hypothetical protein